MARHPTDPSLWKFVGRHDDHILLSHGFGFWASDIESMVASHPDVEGAVIGGQGRAKPFLVVEVSEETRKTLASATDEGLIDHLWPAVEYANQQCLEHVKLSKALTIMTKPSIPFTRTAKATIARKSTNTYFLGRSPKVWRHS
ncbi:MAG: hypothetical protein Q9188_004009 [Gyalolechia gomerana]